MTLTKTGTLDLGGDGVANPGDVITYSFVVTNEHGECDIINIAVTDPMVAPITCPSGNPIPTLAAVPPQQEVCAGTYVITQADIDAGFKENTATASGIIPCEEAGTEAQSTHNEPIPQSPSIALSKSGLLDLGGDGESSPGDLISYTFVVTNDGNVTLTDVAITDPMVSPISCPSGNPIPSLGPGAMESCTGSYAITQADVDAGFKDNTAEVTGDEPVPTMAATRAVTAQASARVPIPQQPLLQLDKSGVADLGADGLADPGDTIDYTLVVTNLGNVTLFGVALTDPLIAAIACPGGNPIPTLAPGASETCSGSYALTAADVAAGSVANTADATGTDPMQQPVTAAASATVDLPIPMPTVGPLGLALLALALLAAGAWFLRRRGLVR